LPPIAASSVSELLLLLIETESRYIGMEMLEIAIDFNCFAKLQYIDGLLGNLFPV
jgi:hypothetical protein